MTPEGIRDALERLHAADAHSVTRFDGGAALSGRVAVLPSAYNPPTAAHLALLDVATQRGADARPVALLSTRNVAKEVFGASLEHRVGMLLALRGAEAGLAVLAVNAARLADQGEALREAFPKTTFDFVVGYDTLVRLFDPVYYSDMESELRQFFRHHRVVATNRGDADAARVRRFVEEEAGAFADFIDLRELHPEAAALSSTLARASVERGEGADGSVPAPVARYIAEHRLYR